MTDNKLISSLVSDLAPIRVKKPIRTTVLSFGISAMGTLIVFGALFSVRSDLQQVLTHSTFLFSTFVALITCLLGFFSVIFLSTPGRNVKYFLGMLSIGLVALIFSLLIWPNQERQAGMAEALPCTLASIILGALSLCIFIFVARKMAPVRPGLVGGLCGVGAACVGMIAIAFHCPSENPIHLLVWHLSLPLIGFIIVGSLVGRKFLRW